MDTIKLLLGATVALLLGALAVSWQGMQSGIKNSSSDELARLEKQVKELRAEQDKLTLEREMLTLKTSPANSPPPTAADIEAVKSQIEANTAAVAQLEMEKTQRDAKLADSEELLLDQRKLESRDHELRRARLISDALLIGRVSEFVEDPQYGGFVTFEVLMPEQVQSGTILAIRRKTGILGQLKVTEIASDGAIASPLPGFNNMKPEPGDELILPPQF